MTSSATQTMIVVRSWESNPALVVLEKSSGLPEATIPALHNESAVQPAWFSLVKNPPVRWLMKFQMMEEINGR